MVSGVIFDFNRTLYDPESLALSDGAIGLLDLLVGCDYRLCLISMGKDEARLSQIHDLGLDPYFVDILVVEGDKTKEDFMRCTQAMSLLPSDVAVIGDRVKKEIYLGNSLGMKTLWYCSGKFSSQLPESEAEEPDHVIHALDEVVKYLG